MYAIESSYDRPFAVHCQVDVLVEYRNTTLYTGNYFNTPEWELKLLMVTVSQQCTHSDCAHCSYHMHGLQQGIEDYISPK